ncbi:MAG: leucine-rich repeat protein [Clostridia bacterium]|nr:leucine-rich repeat protein [Clostridia bacterium]
MKKRILLLLALFMCLICIFTLASCDEDCEHRDADDNAICDNCGENFTDAVDSKIGFKTLAVNGTVVYGKVSNATTSFSFLDEISILGNATFKVFRDLECKDLIESKTATLNSGDNTFYVLEYIGDEVNTLYTVTVRRKPLYTVTFDTANGSAVPSQTVEEDAPLAVPDTPQRADYTFAGWYHGENKVDLTGNWCVTSDMTLVASWTSNPDPSYKVEHYIKKLDGTYELKDSETFTGTVNSEVTPNTKVYEGFTAPTKQTVTVLPNGATLVRYEYTRNSYTITFVTNGGAAVAQQTMQYGATLPNTTRTGYTFGGWLLDNILPTTTLTVPANNTTLYAYWAEENKPSDFMYSGTDQITITDFVGMGTSVCIPAYISGKPVTGIGDRAFWFGFDLTSITIPESVISIGENAFSYCSRLTSITIPEGVLNIGDYAFHDCSSLRSITIPAGLTVIGHYVFENCSSLASITIPTSVASIGSGAFQGCSGLTSITIPASVTSIGVAAFSDCYKLIEIYNLSALQILPGDYGNGYVAYFAKNVYTTASAQSKLFTDNNSYLFYIDGSTRYLMGYMGSATSLTLPANCNGQSYQIYQYAFCENNNLVSIEIPQGITGIGDRAFYGCSSLLSITIPAGVSEIGDGTFYNCSSLASVVLPASVTKIGEWAFYRCSSLTSIAIPVDVTSIDSFTFAHCSSLRSITIPVGVTIIGGGAFEDCSCLTSIVIPEGVTTIEYSAFGYCSSLTSITIPESVINIGNNAFYGCSSLTSIVIPEGVTTIECSAFEKCRNLVSITIPSSVTTIERYAFYDCSSLTSITIPSSVTCIDEYAFKDCSALESVTFKNTVGWWYTTYSFATSGTSVSSSELANKSTAASYLTSIYDSYCWKRS